jgi:hypothetical protein
MDQKRIRLGRSSCRHGSHDEEEPWWYVEEMLPLSYLTLIVASLGVVNAQLKIYDTTNVRVVDASVLPMQISAHLSSTLYGVAEKAADLIKASH